MNLIQRLRRINTVEDAEKELRLAKAYCMRLRTQAKAAATLEEKLSINEQYKQAEAVLRQMRLSIFDIEDALASGKPATSIVMATSA